MQLRTSARVPGCCCDEIYGCCRFGLAVSRSTRSTCCAFALAVIPRSFRQSIAGVAVCPTDPAISRSMSTHNLSLVPYLRRSSWLWSKSPIRRRQHTVASTSDPPTPLPPLPGRCTGSYAVDRTGQVSLRLCILRQHNAALPFIAASPRNFLILIQVGSFLVQTCICPATCGSSNALQRPDATGHLD